MRAGILAPTTLASNSAKWVTVCRFLSKFGLDPLPPSADKVVALGASLKAGSYRSAPTYFSLYRTVARRHGYTVDAAVDQAIRDMSRSCLRGLGGPVRALALPLHRFGGLPGSAEPWSVGGPLGPRNAFVVGSWWLLREIEVSTARACLVQLSVSASGLPRASLQLPASKSDQAALGVTRSHGCGCPDLQAPRPDCPVHAIWDQLLLLRRRFPDRWVEGRPARDLALFPSSEGRVCTKSAVVATLVAGADHLRLPRATPDGTERVSGHSLRASGAQGLARAGLDLWCIQLLGRWGSDAIKTYVREAHLAQSSEWARRALQNQTLEEVAASMAPQVAAARQQGAPILEAVAATSSAMDLPAGAGTTLAQELGAQLVTPILVAADAGAEFAPQGVIADAARHGVEEALAEQERAEAIVVLNGARGVAHRVLEASLDLAPDLHSTACGWKFGGWRDASFPAPEDVPSGYQALCGRCFPRWRAIRKRTLAAPGGASPADAGAPPGST